MRKICLVLGVVASMSSCMIQTHTVGNGGGEVEFARKKSIYIIGNRVSEVDSKELAGGATDYTIDTRYNFMDFLYNGITFGILGTRTVIIKK